MILVWGSAIRGAVDREKHGLDREKIGKVALLKDIGPHERIAEIDRGLPRYKEGDT